MFNYNTSIDSLSFVTSECSKIIHILLSKFKIEFHQNIEIKGAKRKDHRDIVIVTIIRK